MKQVIIQKNPQIKETTGSQIEFYPTGDTVLQGGKVNKIKIPFVAKILSGGKLDLDFKLSQKLAEHGVNLLGAYWNGKEVSAILMPLEGHDVEFGEDVPVLVGTLVQLVSYRQVSGQILGGTMDTEKSGAVLVLDVAPQEKKADTQLKQAAKRKRTPKPE
jgi:hypothetical protein